MPGNAPVDAAPVKDVGGPQTNGPWPEEVEEIARGKAYNRPVFLDGEVREVQVEVKDIRQFVDEQGNKTSGYAVVSHVPGGQL